MDVKIIIRIMTGGSSVLDSARWKAPLEFGDWRFTAKDDWAKPKGFCPTSRPTGLNGTSPRGNELEELATEASATGPPSGTTGGRFVVHPINMR